MIQMFKKKKGTEVHVYHFEITPTGAARALCWVPTTASWEILAMKNLVPNRSHCVDYKTGNIYQFEPEFDSIFYNDDEDERENLVFDGD